RDLHSFPTRRSSDLTMSVNSTTTFSAPMDLVPQGAEVPQRAETREKEILPAPRVNKSRKAAELNRRVADRQCERTELGVVVADHRIVRARDSGVLQSQVHPVVLDGLVLGDEAAAQKDAEEPPLDVVGRFGIEGRPVR